MILLDDEMLLELDVQRAVRFRIQREIAIPLVICHDAVDNKLLTLFFQQALTK